MKNYRRDTCFDAHLFQRLFCLYSWHSLSRHSVYVDLFVKSRILSLYILYTFILYKSRFRLPQHVYRSQTMFSSLNLIVCLDIHCLHNASCENRDPCVFPGQIWNQLTSWGDVNRSLDIQGLRNMGSMCN